MNVLKRIGAAVGAWTALAGIAGALISSPGFAQAVQPATQTSSLALSLDDAVKMAEGQSEAVRIARAGVQRAEGQQLQARSQLLPQIY